MDTTELAAVQARPRLSAAPGGRRHNNTQGGHPGAGSRRNGGGGGGKKRGRTGGGRKVSELFATAGGEEVTVKEKVFVAASGKTALELCVVGTSFSGVRRKEWGGGEGHGGFVSPLAGVFFVMAAPPCAQYGGETNLSAVPKALGSSWQYPVATRRAENIRNGGVSFAPALVCISRRHLPENHGSTRTKWARFRMVIFFGARWVVPIVWRCFRWFYDSCGHVYDGLLAPVATPLGDDRCTSPTSTRSTLMPGGRLRGLQEGRPKEGMRAGPSRTSNSSSVNTGAREMAPSCSSKIVRWGVDGLTKITATLVFLIGASGSPNRSSARRNT